MRHVSDIEALAAAARLHGVDVAAELLLAVVHTAFAPVETMTAEERSFLIASGVPADSFEPRRQAEARARLVARAAATATLLSERLTVADVASRLGCSETTIRRRAHKRLLHGTLAAGRRQLLFPAWQFVGNEPLRGLRDVLTAAPATMGAESLEAFMTTGQEELDGQTPVQWLAAGNSALAVASLIESESWT